MPIQQPGATRLNSAANSLPTAQNSAAAGSDRDRQAFDIKSILTMIGRFSDAETDFSLLSGKHSGSM
jgi:hypothetical protein